MWAFAPVQDRRAAPARSRARSPTSPRSTEVEVIVVARGGGSLADLFAFCDETLCRTVAMLRVPVIASVGHHTDRTLIDDVAAVSCSTPTHAAEAAVPLHPGEARAALARPPAAWPCTRGARVVVPRARAGAAVARAGRARRPPAPRAAPDAARAARERRRAALGDERAGGRAAGRGAAPPARRGRAAPTRPGGGPRSTALALALAAHDPERVVERGYAIVDDRAGNVVTSAEAAREAGAVRLFFADAAVDATITEDEP